jgi:carboxypeptidase PM20D1
VADTESVYFLKLSHLIKACYPGVLVSPYLVLGGTDARQYEAVTDNALRFTPIQMTQEDLHSVHGVNERLSIENCARLVGFYIAYIQEVSSLPGDVDAVFGVEENNAILDHDDLSEPEVIKEEVLEED